MSDIEYKRVEGWTDHRFDQLTVLREIVRECRSINSASHVIQRLERLGILADKLDSDLSLAGRDLLSFEQFLISVAYEKIDDGELTKATK